MIIVIHIRIIVNAIFILFVYHQHHHRLHHHYYNVYTVIYLLFVSIFIEECRS